MYILEKKLKLSKTDFGCPGKIGLSGFCGFNPLARTYPFTVFLTSLSHTHKINREGDPKIPIGDSLVPPQKLRVLG
jgi:hypothetical protein